MARKPRFALPGIPLHIIQRRTVKALDQELMLGREDCKDKIQAMLKRQTRPGKPDRSRVEEAVARYYVI